MFSWCSFLSLSPLLHLPVLLTMHCFTVLFPLWGALLSPLFFLNIHPISVCLESHPVLYSSPYNTPSFHTCYTSHTSRSLLPYTIPTQIGMPHLGCPLYNIPMPFVIRYMLGSFSTLLAVLLMAWPYMLSFPPLLFSTSLAVPFVALPHALLSQLLSSPPFFIVDTSCTCVLFFHIWNTPLSSCFLSSPVSSIPLHTSSPYLLIL